MSPCDVVIPIVASCSLTANEIMCDLCAVVTGNKGLTSFLTFISTG